VVARVRSLSHLEGGGETRWAALDDLAGLGPDWCERSRHRVENDRVPKSERHRTALASHMGADGLQVLAVLGCPDAPAQGKALESVQVLRHVWKQDDEAPGGNAT
jgi:hypothetical protein